MKLIKKAVGFYALLKISRKLADPVFQAINKVI